MSSRLFRYTIGAIAVVQLILGLLFLFAPALFASALGLAAAPAWTAWIFAMFGARALGFAFGMGLALRNPQQHRAWLQAMIAVQAIDWIATLVYVFSGVVTLAQVSTAAFLPIFFIVVLSSGFSRRSPTVPLPHAQLDR